MKTSLLICIILFVAGCGNSKKSENINVPTAVLESFSKQFPTATNVKWSMESENEFEAEYEANDQKQASNYDTSGKWLVTETEISESNIPDTVMSALIKEFIGFKLIKAEKVETHDKGISYELEFEKGEVSYVAEISSEGKILKSKKEKEEKQGEEEDEDEDDGDEDGDEN